MRRTRINQWIWGCTIFKQTKWAYHVHDNFPSPNKMNGRFIGKQWEHDNYRVFGLYFQTCFVGSHMFKRFRQSSPEHGIDHVEHHFCGSNRSKPSTSPWMACLVLICGSIGTLIPIRSHLCRDVDSTPIFKLTHTTRTHLGPICFGVEIDPTAWWNSKSRWNWPPNGRNGWVNNGSINTCNHDRCSNRRCPADEPSAWDWGCPIFPSYRAGYHVGIFATSAAVFHWRQYRKWLGHACHTLLSKHKSWVSSQGLRMCADRCWGTMV